MVSTRKIFICRTSSSVQKGLKKAVELHIFSFVIHSSVIMKKRPQIIFISSKYFSVENRYFLAVLTTYLLLILKYPEPAEK